MESGGAQIIPSELLGASAPAPISIPGLVCEKSMLIKLSTNSLPRRSLDCVIIISPIFEMLKLRSLLSKEMEMECPTSPVTCA